VKNQGGISKEIALQFKMNGPADIVNERAISWILARQIYGDPI